MDNLSNYDAYLTKVITNHLPSKIKLAIFVKKYRLLILICCWLSGCYGIFVRRVGRTFDQFIRICVNEHCWCCWIFYLLFMIIVYMMPTVYNSLKTSRSWLFNHNIGSWDCCFAHQPILLFVLVSSDHNVYIHKGESTNSKLHKASPWRWCCPYNTMVILNIRAVKVVKNIWIRT